MPVAGRLTVPQDGLSSAAADEEKTALNVTVQLSPWQKDDRRHSMCRKRHTSDHCLPQIAETLHVRYHGGRYVNQAQYANIQFLCDHEAEEVSHCVQMQSTFTHHCNSRLHRLFCITSAVSILFNGGLSTLAGKWPQINLPMILRLRIQKSTNLQSTTVIQPRPNSSISRPMTNVVLELGGL